MSRKIRFGVLFAGLGVVTLAFLLVLARFVLVLLPAGAEQTTLQAHPIVVTEVVTVVVEVEVTPTPVLEQSDSSHLPTTATPTAATPAALATNLAAPRALLPDPQSPTPEPPTPTAVPQPAQLIIPSLDVAKTIMQIPVEDGQWNIESLASGIGHLQTTGIHPGDDMGMTFIAHVTRPWPEGAGPFADLIFMQPGDEIIYRWRGIDYVYELEAFDRVQPERVESLYVADGDVITLATCDTWDYVNWDYANRLLARARLVRQELAQEQPARQDEHDGPLFSQ